MFETRMTDGNTEYRTMIRHTNGARNCPQCEEVQFLIKCECFRICRWIPPSSVVHKSVVREPVGVRENTVHNGGCFNCDRFFLIWEFYRCSLLSFSLSCFAGVQILKCLQLNQLSFLWEGKLFLQRPVTHLFSDGLHIVRGGKKGHWRFHSTPDS
jgi:hypothetical protein